MVLVLTADVGAGLELGLHLGVDVDHHLPLLLHEGIPLLDLLLDPVLERLADHRGAHVHDPLLGRLREVRRVGQVVVDVGMLADELADALQGEIVVLRHMARPDLVVLQGLLLAADDVLEEVDRHVVCSPTGISQKMGRHLPYLPNIWRNLVRLYISFNPKKIIL